MGDTHIPGGKCCCGYEPPPPPKPKAPRVNNLRIQPTQFCCGLAELGNFNYIDPPDGKRMTHYHKVGSGWQTQQNVAPEDGTSLADIKQVVAQNYSSGMICTTGAGQEYVEPLLAEAGFEHISTFYNPGHANTAVKVWIYRKHKEAR